MSRRWLLSLLCLSVSLLLLVQLTRARGELRVSEAKTRILLQKEPAEVLLAVENLSDEIQNTRVEVELLDPRNQVASNVTQVQAIERGNQTLTLSLPIYVSKLKEKDRSQLLWYRLHYRLRPEASPTDTIAEGIISLSEITPDLFEVRVATSQLAREGGRYRTRVQATHPITRRPAANVRVDGEVTLEDDNDKSVKLRASGITDATGYVLLDFQLPARFPRFPHTNQPAGGEIHVIGQRGALIAEAKGDVLVDQFPRVLISSDKPIYQPGQVLHARALIFSPSKHALANQDILIRICDPEETNVFRTVVKSSRFGIANADWPIPENTRLGDYRIWVGVDGGEESGQTAYDVRISRYDLPNFSVNVQSDRKYYLPGQNAELKVRADYLFGQPVTHGHVRIVRETDREWNYREQKWDIEEGDKYEGETDAKGFFLAHINLADDQKEFGDEEYRRFKDITYAAYFTDPTTNRTEQRRFDLRVTKEAIHVYVVENDYDSGQNRRLPLRFYVSTFYADGSPAQCKVNVRLSNSSNNSGKEIKNPTSRLLAALGTNRYGLAKVSGFRLPREFENEGDVDLVVSAVDARGQMGSKTENLSLDDTETVLVDTDKTLYRAGEPITVLITSSLRDKMVVVDLARDSSVIRSERVQLHNGRGSITLSYKPDFKDKLTIAAYADFPDSQRMIGTHTILYPHNSDLNVNVRTSQTSYRPGEDAQVSLRVRAPEGGQPQSALGVVVFDKAVDERSRTDQEFGHHFYTFNESLQRFLGFDEQMAGVTLRDLQRTDMSKPVSPEVELVAEVLLNQSRDYSPAFYGGDEYETEQAKVFGDSIKEELKPLREALATRYVRTAEYPNNVATLQRLLSQSQIDLSSLRDPWGTPYRAVFSVDKQSDVLTLISAGADKHFDTDDDFSVERLSWPYFRPVGESIDRAVRQYHERTSAFIRDFATLRSELSRDGLAFDQIRDRWGEPYRFDFEVNDSNYVIKVKSGGPDKQFSVDDRYLGDDFIIWTSTIDYFADLRARIEAALTQDLKSKNRFPQNDLGLRDALRNSGAPFESLRDPWNRPYYATFKTQSFYADRVRIENRGNFGESAITRTETTPVTQMVALINLRSTGPDGKPGTADDFDVATFAGVISEQARGESKPQALTSGVVLSGSSGAITGVVTDANGAAIPGATVTATRSIDSQSYHGSSNDDGKYGFANLSSGLYEVRFEARGFMATVFTNVLVRASNITELNATLRPGAVTETVTVTAAAPSVQTQSSNSSLTVSGRQLSRLRNVNVITKSGGSQQASTPRLREYFPETLVWQPSVETDTQGRAQLTFKLADNITTWKMAVIGSTEDGRIGTAEKEIKAFQPFFVELDPPRVLTEGDEISQPVVVRNYLERAQQVDLEMKPENWFSLLGPARKRSDVAAGDAARTTFDFRAIASVRDGKQRITATGADANDAIEKPITVHPDGEELSATASDIVGRTATLELNVPEATIPNSARAELKIYPNLMAHVIESVEAIMARPYGCGEQTISSTYPSLLLMRHYQQTGEDFPLRARAQRYLGDGYSRLLNYRDESGGFTYWGRGEPDLALTAYALRFLSDARNVVSVDEDVINEARDWLVKQQRADGSWPAHEYWSNSEDKQRSAMLTAYVARVLATTETKIGSEASKDKSVAPKTSDAKLALKRALDYLGQRVEEIDEPYLLASYALAAIDAQDSVRATPAITKLRSLAHTEGSTTYWSLETNTPFYGWGLAGRVETTALVVQALTKYCNSQAANCGLDSNQSSSIPQSEVANRSASDVKLINQALLFLLKQKDRYGVWYSTQATINVLDAMLALLSKNSQNQTNSATQSAADIVVNGRVVQTIQIPVASRLSNPITFDISRFLQTGKNGIEIRRASGSPFASAQAVVNYYVPWLASDAAKNAQLGAVEAGSLRFVAKFDKTEGKVNDEITCHVEAGRVGFHGYGMMLAEIGLPPGADVDRSSLETAMTSSDWAISQYDVLPDRVMVYLWPRAGGVKFDFHFRPRFGLNAKTAPSLVYDYYNPEARAIVVPKTFRIR
jgi:hypothetical protein